MALSRFLFALPVLALLALLALLPGSPPASAGSYEVDPVHSTVLFKVKHLGVSNFYGRFNAFSGSLSFPAEGSGGSVEVEVKAESVDTGNEKRDQHLRGPDFFNARQFPLITFKSKEVKRSGEGSWEVSGDLTLHGVARPLSLKVRQVGAGKGQRGEERAGFEAVFAIQRSDHGMKFMLNGVSDEVEVTVSLAAVRK